MMLPVPVVVLRWIRKCATPVLAITERLAPVGSEDDARMRKVPGELPDRRCSAVWRSICPWYQGPDGSMVVA